MSGNKGTKKRGGIYKPGRVTMSLRIDPDLHKRILSHCDDMQISANAYMISLLEKDLKKVKK